MKSVNQQIIALFLAATSPAIAYGQNENIQEIIVKDQYLSLDKVDAVKTPTPIVDIPQSLSIVSGESIKQQSLGSISDITRYTPGLAASQGEGHRDAVIIRGIQTTADFFIDGIRDDVQYYRPLYNLERVEILRGSNALLFGRGGGGGVINRVLKNAEVNEQFTDFSASGDTFGAYSVSVDSNLTISDSAAFRINAINEELDNHRDFFEGDTQAVNPTFTIQFNEKTEATFSLEYVDSERIVDRGVPSVDLDPGNPDSVNEPLENFEETFFGSPEENFTTLEALTFNARVDHEFSDYVRGNLTLVYADFDKLYSNLFPSDDIVITNGTFSGVELDGYLDTTERQNLFIQGNLVGEFNTGSVHHTILLGFEFGEQDTLNARFDNVFADNGDDQLFVNFINGQLNIPDFSLNSNLARDRDSRVKTQSVYFQDQIDLSEAFTLVLGARFDKFDIDIDVNDLGSNTIGQFSRVDEEVTPRGGLIYKPAEHISLYYSYSETFLPRSGEQFLTLNITQAATEPQFFSNDEIGFKWDFKSGLSLTTALFELEQESFTTVDPADQGNTIVIAGSEIQGFEIQLSGQVTPAWDIIAGYSFLDGEVVDPGDANNGNDTRQTPEDMFSLWNKISVSENVTLGLGVTHQSSFFVLENNSTRVPDYTRVDAAVYFQLNDSSNIQVNIENLFDTEYFPDAHSNNNISVGAPINAQVSYYKRF